MMMKEKKKKRQQQRRNNTSVHFPLWSFSRTRLHPIEKKSAKSAERRETDWRHFEFSQGCPPHNRYRNELASEWNEFCYSSFLFTRRVQFASFFAQLRMKTLFLCAPLASWNNQIFGFRQQLLSFIDNCSSAICRTHHDVHRWEVKIIFPILMRLFRELLRVSNFKVNVLRHLTHIRRKAVGVDGASSSIAALETN